MHNFITKKSFLKEILSVRNSHVSVLSPQHRYTVRRFYGIFRTLPRNVVNTQVLALVK